MSIEPTASTVCGGEDSGALASAGGHVSDSFRLLNQVMPVLPEETVRQLHHVLGARLALPSSSVRRRERLGLILDFLNARGRAPTASEYRDQYAERRRRGHPAVPLSTLEGYYGSYAQAVEWGAKLHGRGTAARAQACERGNKPPRYWNEPRCLDGLEGCRKLLGDWPSESEFAALRRAGSALSAVQGCDGLTLPWPPVIERLFGSYGEMVAVGQRRAHDLDAGRRTGHATVLGLDPESSPRRRGRSVARRQRSSNIEAPRESP